MKKAIRFGLLGAMALCLLASCDKEKDNKGGGSGEDLDFDVTIEMVYVEGGEFQMGPVDGNGYVNEQPVRTVKLNSYYIGKYEITQAEWKAVMGTTLAQQAEAAGEVLLGVGELAGEGDNYPMYYVSHGEAVKFCERLSKKTGKKYVLPTEAQWEYAARGGNKSQGYLSYSGSDDLDQIAWYNLNSDGMCHPVGTKLANELGIYDMCGNVWEFCSDFYDDYDPADTDNPTGPKEDMEKGYSARGGSYDDNYRAARVSTRINYDPGHKTCGFRIAMIP